MASYVILFRFTEQGIRNIKEGPARLESAKQVFRKAGCEVRQFFLVMGDYDTVVLVDGPDDEAVTRACLTIGALGNVRSTTLRAYSEDEYRKLISSMP